MVAFRQAFLAKATGEKKEKEKKTAVASNLLRNKILPALAPEFAAGLWQIVRLQLKLVQKRVLLLFLLLYP